MMSAIQVYRSEFRPSQYLDRSHLMLGLNVVAADSDNEARRLFTSHQQLLLRLSRRQLGPLPPPIDPDRFEAGLTPIERSDLQRTQSSAVVGSAETVLAGVADFIGRTSPDELIVTAQIFDHAARVHSYEILQGVAVQLPGGAEPAIQPASEI
jgi:alkanesulfonate monooxygenase SsuD/methylene tetrahydromethanopterin reductase-like flavin-dependent oxidoreductase (luciferase family)